MRSGERRKPTEVMAVRRLSLQFAQSGPIWWTKQHYSIIKHRIGTIIVNYDGIKEEIVTTIASYGGTRAALWGAPKTHISNGCKKAVHPAYNAPLHRTQIIPNLDHGRTNERRYNIIKHRIGTTVVSLRWDQSCALGSAENPHQ